MMTSHPRMVLGQAPHLHVASLPDDDRMEPVPHQRRQRTVGVVHQRARGLDHGVSPAPHLGEQPVARAVGGDHDGRCGERLGAALEPDAAFPQIVDDGRVMDEVSQDGHRTARRFGLRERDGVADTETHPEMVSTEDIHGMLCIAEFLDAQIRRISKREVQVRRACATICSRKPM